MIYGWVNREEGQNSYRLVVSCGVRPDGTKNKKTRTIKASGPKQAKEELVKFAAEIKTGFYVEPSKLTFRDFTKRWFRDYAESNLAPKNVHHHRQIIGRIYQAMGHLKIEEIKPTHLLDFYTNLQEDGIRNDGKEGKLSIETIHHHRLISSIMQTAVDLHVIPMNPASRAKPPKSTKTPAAYYDETQTATLLQAIEGELQKYKAMIYIAVFGGLRRGEIFGLEWPDVNFDENTINIQRVSQYIPGKRLITKGPKNETSKRIITLPSFVMAVLKQHKVEQAQERLALGDMWQNSNRLFTTWDGQPMHLDTITKWFPKFIARHKLPPLTFHGLWHTAATLLIGQGLHAKITSGRLGHADIGTTMNIYGHFLKSADKQAADILEQVFGNLKA